MNTKTGEILALASYPDYEPQLFVNGISTEKYNEYRETESLYKLQLKYPNTISLKLSNYILAELETTYNVFLLTTKV